MSQLKLPVMVTANQSIVEDQNRPCKVNLGKVLRIEDLLVI
jgi:hypothetical protein